MPEPTGPLTPRQRWTDLRKGSTFTLGGRSFVIIRDMGDFTKLLGDPAEYGPAGYSGQTYYGTVDAAGVVTVSRLGKREFRPVGKPLVQGHLGMQSGEWWLDAHGNETFADGDVGETNHELVAVRAAFELDEEDEIPRLPLSSTWAQVYLDRGVRPEVVDYFRQRNADARDYAVEHMSWTRVKGKNFEVWLLDDDRLRHIQHAEFWDEEDEDSEEPVLIEEQSTGKLFSIPMRALLAADSAAQLKMTYR